MSNALSQLAEFQASIALQERFDPLADPAAYQTLPDGWIIGAADIVGSTGAIAKGSTKLSTRSARR